MDETEETREYSIAPVKANVWDFVCAFATFSKGVAQAFVDGWAVVEVSAIAASGERTERFIFQRDAGRSIESITRGEHG